MYELHHTHQLEYTCWLEDVAFLCISAVDTSHMKEVDDMSRGDSDNSQYSLLFGIDRSSSEPVEDTDTTGFVAEFVSTFSLFFPTVMCLYNCLVVLTCLLFSLFCADFLLFYLESEVLQ